jgi:hypothetical protein
MGHRVGSIIGGRAAVAGSQHSAHLPGKGVGTTGREGGSTPVADTHVEGVGSIEGAGRVGGARAEVSGVET